MFAKRVCLLVCLMVGLIVARPTANDSGFVTDFAAQDVATISAAAVPQDIQWVPVGDRGSFPSQGWAWGFSLALDSHGNPWVAFPGSAAGVMRFNGTAWQAVGVDPFGSSAADISLALDVYDTPYVAFNLQDGGDYCSQVKVLSFNGTNWQPVGDVPLAANGCSTSMALDSSGNPWVAYADGDAAWPNDEKARVKRFDGTKWVDVGNVDFSIGHVDRVKLALDAQDKPYVAYTDHDLGPQGWWATVMTLAADNTWQAVVGSADGLPSNGEAVDLSLALDPQGKPWVAFRQNNTDEATVLKSTVTEWVAVKNVDLTALSGRSTSLVIDGFGTPYLAFVDQTQTCCFDPDGGYRFKATVVRFDGTSWQPAGPAGFSAGEADQTVLALDPNGRLYVAFRDGTAGNKATVMNSQLKPTITCRASWTEEATLPTGANVVLNVTVSGEPAHSLATTWFVDDMASAAATHSLSAGATQDNLIQSLALGSHSVMVSVRDGLADPVSCSTTVRVVDTTKPTITAPADVTVQQVGSGGTSVNIGTATASDIVDANPNITNNAPASFPVGTTLVTWTATDFSDNAATATQKVTVTAAPPSTITVTATPSTIWPPNKKMIPVKLVVTPGDATARIVSVTCNEAIAASDWKMTGRLTLNLRADRNGNGTGRVYTITVAYGTSSTTTVLVKVPHDQGK